MVTDRPRALNVVDRFEASRTELTSMFGRASVIDVWCLKTLARMLAGVRVRFVLWDGTAQRATNVPTIADIVIHDRPTLVSLLWSTDLHFGEAYTDGRLHVDGDLVGLLTEIARCTTEQVRSRWIQLIHRGGAAISAATRNAQHHYDLGNDFYQRWLDRELVYTCAYFPAPDASLEDAQHAKMDLVSRKLSLEPGELVYEAGCGWGSLALHMAKNYGVRVRAWNVSRQQIAWARHRAAQEHLANSVEFIEGDYRTIDGTCDAFVSVGMLEHVGARQYASLSDVINRSMHPAHGRGLIHFIGRSAPMAMSTWISRYIFPGAYIPSLREAIEGVLEPADLTVLDVENLRLHYALTLAHWLERFEAVSEDVSADLGEVFARMWQLYLAEAQAGFRAGNLQLFQVVFARSAWHAIPWTRESLYHSTDLTR
jgi:cyclopropane-fatty-acyl-phospholipid synthase